MIRKTLLTVSTALAAIVVLATPLVSHANSNMIFGAIGDDGSGPPGAFNFSITAVASTTIGANRNPTNTINGVGVEFLGGDATEVTNYVNDAGNSHFGDDYNWGASAVTGWFKADLGLPYVLSNAFFYNYNPNNDEAPDPTQEDRGVDEANVWYLSGDNDPGNNTDGNASAFNSTGWTLLGNFNFTIAPSGDVSQVTPDVILFSNVTARFVALEIISNHGDGGSVGFGEIQFFGEPILPTITLVVIEDTVGVTFDSASNITYRLQSTPDLVSSNFTDTGAFVVGNGGSMTMFDPAGTSTTKNYRVVLD